MTYIKLPLKNVLTVRSIITLYYFDFPPEYRTRGESHDFWEMVYVSSGGLWVRDGDERRHLRCGDVILHAPNVFHNVECDGTHPASVFIVTFICSSSAMQFFRSKVFSVPPELRSAITNIIDEGMRNFEVGKYPLTPLPDAPIGGQQLFHMYLEEFLIRLMRTGQDGSTPRRLFTSKKNLEDCLAADVIAYLHDHLSNAVSLEDVCRHFHFGKSHLCRIFKENTGYSIMHYYSGLRVERAKVLLRTTSESIAAIADQLGFESPEYFARVFRKHMGCSPSAFR